MKDTITQTGETCTRVCLVSGHTFHFLVSSALGTLLVSVRSMRTEKHKGQKESSVYFSAFNNCPETQHPRLQTSLSVLPDDK